MNFLQACFVAAVPVLLTWFGLTGWALFRTEQRNREAGIRMDARVRELETKLSAANSRIEFYDHWFLQLARKANLEPWNVGPVAGPGGQHGDGG